MATAPDPTSSSPAPEPTPNASPPPPTTVGDIFRQTVALYPKLLVALISVTLPLALINGLNELSPMVLGFEDHAVIQILMMLITFIAGAYFWCVAVYQIDHVYKGSDGETTPWDQGTQKFIPFLITFVIITILSTVGIFACLIPGLLAMFFLFPAQFLVVLDDYSPLGSLSRSIELVRTNLGHALGFFLTIFAASMGLAMVLFILLFTTGVATNFDPDAAQLMMASIAFPLIIFSYPAAMALYYLFYRSLLALDAQHAEPPSSATDEPPAPQSW